MTTYAELAAAIAEHASEALDIRAYDWPTLQPEVPAVVVHPGGHATFIDFTGGSFGTFDVSYSLLTFQAVGDEREALLAFYSWAETMRTAFDDFTVPDGDVGSVVVLRVLEPRIVQPLAGMALFAGQFDITVSLSTC